MNRIRDQIWGFCTAIRSDQEPVVVGHRLLLYTTNEQGAWDYPPERFDSLIPLANKQIYGEAYDLFCRKNRFNLVLNEGSCIGPLTKWPKTGLKDDPSIAAMPSLWNFAFRHSVRQIQKFRIFVVFNSEHEHEHGERLAAWEEWKKKNESSLIVSDAVENLCEILALSRILTSVEIVYMDLGRPELTIGHEPGILTPFGRLRRIRHVKVDGAPEFWAQYLESSMELDK